MRVDQRTKVNDATNMQLVPLIPVDQNIRLAKIVMQNLFGCLFQNGVNTIKLYLDFLHQWEDLSIQKTAVFFIQLVEGTKIKMVLLTYSIEQTLFCYFLLTQLAKENRELCSDSSSFIEEVLGRIFNRLHLFPFYVGEYSQIVGSTLLRQNNHVSMESSGDEARRLTFQRTGLELLQGFVLQLNQFSLFKAARYLDYKSILLMGRNRVHFQEKILICVPTQFFELSSEVVVLFEQFLHLSGLIILQHPKLINIMANSLSFTQRSINKGSKIPNTKKYSKMTSLAYCIEYRQGYYDFC